jgi:hypothetical protein
MWDFLLFIYGHLCVRNLLVSSPVVFSWRKKVLIYICGTYAIPDSIREHFELITLFVYSWQLINGLTDTVAINPIKNWNSRIFRFLTLLKKIPWWKAKWDPSKNQKCFYLTAFKCIYTNKCKHVSHKMKHSCHFVCIPPKPIISLSHFPFLLKNDNDLKLFIFCIESKVFVYVFWTCVGIWKCFHFIWESVVIYPHLQLIANVRRDLFQPIQ